MTFDKWFYKQNKLLQIILLLIPGLNWVVEFLIRFSVYTKTRSILHLLLVVLMIPCGMLFGWVDLVWLLLFDHLLLAK